MLIRLFFKMNFVYFVRIIKEITSELYIHSDIRWQRNAVLALQEVAEAYLIALFEDINIVAQNSNRVTIMQKDLHVVRRIRGCNDIANR